MRSTQKFLLALVMAFVVMMMFRALVFTIYTVPGSTLEPTFKNGDRVMVNRWSYGLRTGGDGLFSYGRLWQQNVEKDDWVAFEDSLGHVLIGRCSALPGDTIRWQQRMLIVPGKVNCAHHDFYRIEPFGLIREEQIIGRVMMVVYNHTPGYVLWRGYDTERILLPK